MANVASIFQRTSVQKPASVKMATPNMPGRRVAAPIPMPKVTPLTIVMSFPTILFCPPGTYDCHINVEICASIKAIKYIHKYIYKGHDRATLEMGEDIDEILEHISFHFIGPPEGCWHIFEFPLHEEKPSVYRLPVHEEDQQMVYFDDDDDDPEEFMGRDSIKKTHLTEWFTANRALEGAKDATYQDFPQAFTWDKKTKKWNIRRQCHVIGRMYF